MYQRTGGLISAVVGLGTIRRRKWIQATMHAPTVITILAEFLWNDILLRETFYLFDPGERSSKKWSRTDTICKCTIALFREHVYTL